MPLVRLLPASASKLCKTAWPKPFCWAKLAHFDFSSWSFSFARSHTEEDVKLAMCPYCIFFFSFVPWPAWWKMDDTQTQKFGSSYACFGCVIDIKRHKKMPPSAHYTLKKCIIRPQKKLCIGQHQDASGWLGNWAEREKKNHCWFNILGHILSTSGNVLTAVPPYAKVSIVIK